MSAYKLIKILKTSEKETQSLSTKNDIEQALADMHNLFGADVKSDSTLSVYCIVIDLSTGAKIDGLHWSKTFIDVPEEIPDTSIKQRVYIYNDDGDNIYSYDSEQLAIGNYHTRLAAQRNDQDVSTAITIRIDSNGDYADFDYWTRKIKEDAEA